MSYLVLARKYRPQNFSDVIGQEHIVEILEKSLTSNRVAHAYLFCGPRGIGKTSCARILAKSLNCEKGPTITPCGKCSSCTEITKSTSFDVIEIDGASNRGIDEIRTLRENVKFAPSYGRYKIYIVDEVHMLTSEAFNALLKTLEEPPEHVKFIFATTAPNKLPSTIISRCQRFDFKRISLNRTIDILSDICKKEKFTIDQDALFAVSKAAQGSLRDSLSILDQMSALSDRKISARDVCSMLGVVEVELLFELVDALGDKNCRAALECLEKIISGGKDVKQLSKDLTEHFRNLMVIKVGGKQLGRLVDYPVAIKDMILAQTEKFELKEILESIEILIQAQDVARITESLRMPLEVAFAKITSNGNRGSGKPAAAPVSSGSSPSAPSAIAKTQVKPQSSSKPSALAGLKNEKGHVDISPMGAIDPTDIVGGVEAEYAVAESMLQAQIAVEEPAQVLDLPRIRQSWNAITHAISKQRMSVATFLQEGSPYDFQGEKLTIAFPKEAAFHKEALEGKDVLALIERNFSEKLRKQIRIELKVMDNVKPQDDEPLVKNALETFKGKVVNKWHNE